MAYCFKQKILFKHCDPAGIVFYPRYFEMMNDAVEAFFSDVVGVPFEQLLKTSGVPTVQTECKFIKPGRHGDQLDIQLICCLIGRSSVTLQFDAQCEHDSLFTAKATLVHVNQTGTPTPWPDSIRAVLQAEITGEKM